MYNEVEVRFERLYFRGGSEALCDQKMKVRALDGSVEDLEICKKDWSKQVDEMFAQCYRKSSHLSISYTSEDEEEEAAFIIEVKGRHRIHLGSMLLKAHTRRKTYSGTFLEKRPLEKFA